MRREILDKVLVSVTRLDVNDIIHELCLSHILHSSIFICEKELELVEDTVRRKKSPKLVLQYFELLKKGGNELPSFALA